MKKVKVFNHVMTVMMIAVVMLTLVPVNAKVSKGSLNQFYVTRKYKMADEARTKKSDSGSTVDLKKDSGCAWIQYKVLNKHGKVGAQSMVQRGSKSVTNWRLDSYKGSCTIYLRRAYGDKDAHSTIVKGTWSPDYF